MSKQVLSVRDFAIIYDLIRREMSSVEYNEGVDGHLDGFVRMITGDALQSKLSVNKDYQDLLRIRDALGTLNIEIETPDVSVVEEEPCAHMHTKVYDKSILMSNPPKRNWTCALCGVKGSDWVESALDSIMFQNGSSMETIPCTAPVRGKAKT